MTAPVKRPLKCPVCRRRPYLLGGIFKGVAIYRCHRDDEPQANGVSHDVQAYGTDKRHARAAWDRAFGPGEKEK